MQIIEFAIPEYTVDRVPDHREIGKQLDDVLCQHFLGKEVLIRGIGSSEHPGKTIDQLVEIIRRTGSDRYDPKRKGDRYENVEGKQIDLFAFAATITPDVAVCDKLIYGFYHSALGFHGRPVRIDVIIVYDATRMRRVLHRYAGRDDVKDDGFVFKNPNDKPAAVLGVIKVI